MDLAAAKALLQKQEGGTSLYDHLTEVILKVLVEQPANAVAAFEQISSSVKAGAYPVIEPGARAGGAAAAAELSSAFAARLQAQADLLKAPGGEEGPAGAAVQDFTEEASYLEWAGINLGRTEAFRIHLALKHLAAKFPATQLRFWGKLLGREADYYIAEGIMEGDAGEEEASDALGNAIQKTGEGPNKFTYFVCSAIGQPWHKLPNVTPHQIIVARQTRRFLSGNRAAPVAGHPPFPGSEENLLRAMIALISAATVAVPADMYTPVPDDENGAIQNNEEEGWSIAEVASVSSYVHRDLGLNAIGRTKPNPPKKDEAGEDIADPDPPETSAPLKPLAEDEAVEKTEDGGDVEGGGAWDARPAVVSGMPADGSEQPAIGVLRSLRYPGAVTVGFLKKRTVSLYIGYGHEAAIKPYEPQLPGALQKEFDFSGAGEGGVAIAEKPEVTVDPDAGKKKEGEEGGEEGAE